MPCRHNSSSTLHRCACVYYSMLVCNVTLITSCTEPYCVLRILGKDMVVLAMCTRLRADNVCIFVQPKNIAPTGADYLLTGIHYTNWDTIAKWIHSCGINFFQDYMFTLPAVPYTEVCVHDLSQRCHVNGCTLYYIFALQIHSVQVSCNARKIFIKLMKNRQNKPFYTHWACHLQAVFLQTYIIQGTHSQQAGESKTMYKIYANHSCHVRNHEMDINTYELFCRFWTCIPFIFPWFH